VQAVIIIACQYYSATNLAVAQEAQVENPCLICPDGATAGDDYVPYASKDPITCKELIDNATLFETGSLWCARFGEAGVYCCTTTPENPCTLCPNGITVADDYEPYNDGDTCSDKLDYYADFDAMSDICTIFWGAEIESLCCPTVANNPCIICPDGATAGEEIVPYVNDTRTCKDIIEAALTFDAESEMCLGYAKNDEYKCCPSSTTAFDDYCNICPDGITAGDDFVPWSSGFTCKQLVQNANIVYENGSVGCNYFTGYELSCCPGAGIADSESTPITPPSTTTTQEAQVEDPCLICPDGATSGDDHVPYPSRDPITCKELIDNATLFETGSLWCARFGRAGMYCCPTTPQNPCTLCPNGITVADDYQPYNDGDTCSYWLDYYANFDAESDTCTAGWGADIESRCCPTEANNPCIICPDGATAGEDFVPYTNDTRTCKDHINADLTFDAESEMCLVLAKEDKYECCPSSTTEFDDYCNICPGGITAGDDFVPWFSGFTCKDLVQNAKIYENGSVGCNHYKGYELSCCPAITPPFTPISISPPSFAPTPSSTPINPLNILEITASVVGIISALVGAAFAFARWKQKLNLSSAIPTTVATSTNTMSSTSILTASTTVPQPTNVCNTPMPSQPTPTQGPRSSSLDTSRSFKDLIGEI
jgi:hypothetical protein